MRLSALCNALGLTKVNTPVRLGYVWRAVTKALQSSSLLTLPLWLRAAPSSILMENGGIVPHTFMHRCKLWVAIIQLQDTKLLSLFWVHPSITKRVAASCISSAQFQKGMFNASVTSSLHSSTPQCLISVGQTACLLVWLEVSDIAREGSHKFFSAGTIFQVLYAWTC